MDIETAEQDIIDDDRVRRIRVRNEANNRILKLGSITERGKRRTYGFNDNDSGRTDTDGNSEWSGRE